MTVPTKVGPSPTRGGPVVQQPLELSSRKLQIVRFAANGFTNAEIGRELYLSTHTVNDYWRQIYKALGAVDRTNAVALALVRGLVRPDEVQLRPPRGSAV